MDSLILVLITILIVQIIVLFLLWKNRTGNMGMNASDVMQPLTEKLEHYEKVLRDEFSRIRGENTQSAQVQRSELNDRLEKFEQTQKQNLSDQNTQLRDRLAEVIVKQEKLNEDAEKRIKEVKLTVEGQLKEIRDDNSKRLEEMRKTVDEKLEDTLQKRLGESFKLVSERLELVHKGLGEMQQLATGVGDLKKVLDNVKTRGVLGEYQLENILEQLLTPEQYDKNVATKKDSQAHVEFAVRLPGKNTDEPVWMPIDSKFPIQGYEALLNSYDVGDPKKIDAAQKHLLRTIESFAKSISEKYINPPFTTDFAILFLPIESLYAEVLRHPGLFESLQRKYRITVTGPTTLSALLNSLHMGFRTLQVQERSSEVWKILESVKSEFGKFAAHLEKVDKDFAKAHKSLQTLRNTRTNVLERKLQNIAQLDEPSSGAPLLTGTSGAQEPESYDEGLDEEE
ncbi:MAG: DNA recombination protein RmuC [Bacteroidota bacterium]